MNSLYKNLTAYGHCIFLPGTQVNLRIRSLPVLGCHTASCKNVI